MSHSQFDDEEHITTSSDERLIYMANQISKFFASQKHDAAVEGCRDHIAKFWDPTMLRGIFAHLDKAGGAGLHPVALQAVQKVRDASAQSIQNGVERHGGHSGREPGADAG